MASSMASEKCCVPAAGERPNLNHSSLEWWDSTIMMWLQTATKVLITPFPINARTLYLYSGNDATIAARKQTSHCMQTI